MPTIPIRSDNTYLGIGLQPNGQGTATAPTNFPRALDGSSIELDAKMEDVWEMDGSRRLSMIIKNSQMAKIKLVVTPRPVEAGLLERAAHGLSADVVTAAATPSTTTTATITANVSTSVAVAAGTGFAAPATGTIQCLVDGGTAVAEVVTFTLPIATLTLTVAASYNGGKFKNSHSSGATVVGIATVDSSVTSNSIVGAGTLSVGNNNGLSGFPLTLCVSQGTAAEEFVTFSGVTGAGPYSLTVAASYNGGAMLNAHSSGDAVVSGVSHVMTDQYDGSYYSIEVGLGSLNAQGGITLRVRDCKLESIKRSGKAGSLLLYEVEFSGLVTVVQGSPATVTLENHQPILFTNGVWTLDGSTTGDALTVEEFDLTQKNNTDWVQAEKLTGEAIIFGRVQVDVSIKIIYQSSTLYIQKTYMGGTGGTTDAQAVGTGSLLVTFASVDNLSSIAYKILTLVYTKAGLPVQKSDGKHYSIPLQASSTSNQGQNAYVLQSTVVNSQSTPYN